MSICIRTCACGGWGERGKIRMAREARKSRKYEGQLTKPELNTYVCRRPVSRCQRLVGVNSHSVVLIVTD